ncbi:MAG: hypothetical protein JWM36_1422 [Hyphomicrobiales bacterium]|nr:hypothetical protein [Hyphomicrobiales bacterium]
MGIQSTQVVFTPTVAGCTVSCTYTANVAWTWGTMISQNGTMSRTCGTLAGVAEGVKPTGKTLPQNLFGPSALIVVDLSFNYVPLIGSVFVPPIRLVKQAFYAPRFTASYITVADPADTARCPGF